MADFDTLQAVIANRYDVMAKYAKSVKRAFREELAHAETHQSPRESPAYAWRQTLVSRATGRQGKPRRVNRCRKAIRQCADASYSTRNCARICRQSGSARISRVNNYSASCRTGAIVRNKVASTRCRTSRFACVATPDRSLQQLARHALSVKI